MGCGPPPPGLLFCSPLWLSGVSLTRACCFWACLQQQEEFQRPQGIVVFLCRIKNRDGCAYKQHLIEESAGEAAQGRLVFAWIPHTPPSWETMSACCSIWRSVLQQHVVFHHHDQPAGPADPIAASSALLPALASFCFVSSCGLPGPCALVPIPFPVSSSGHRFVQPLVGSAAAEHSQV